MHHYRSYGRVALHLPQPQDPAARKTRIPPDTLFCPAPEAVQQLSEAGGRDERAFHGTPLPIPPSPPPRARSPAGLTAPAPPKSGGLFDGAAQVSGSVPAR